MAKYSALTLTHKLLFIVATALILVAGVWSSDSSSAKINPYPKTLDTTSTAQSSDERSPTPTPSTLEEPDMEVPANSRSVTHKVRKGDTLSSIFSSAGAPQSDLNSIMQADVEFLALETLKPGTRLRLSFDQHGEFTDLALETDPARTIFFRKTDNDSFEYTQVEADTHWVYEVLRGDIQGSFYLSAKHAGLSDAQIASIRQLLERQLNFRRDLRAGDRFSVMIGHEMTGDQQTGNTRVEAVEINQRKSSHMAFRFEDGNYYNEDGKSVLPAFRRWPTPTSYRVSSSFNPNRKHPITGRRSPHNGTDLATPAGTPVLTTGDGVVDRVGNHRYAGKYIDIDHGNAYKTRYLHLNRILVKKGQRVERGQKIALSGNTGRSTGAHLHFELHINGRPVNAMTAEIPTAADVPRQDVARFKQAAEYQLAVMSDAASRSNLMLAGIAPAFD